MKKELLQLESLLTKLGNYFDDKKIITIAVLVQNAAFHADEWNWEDFNPIQQILKEMKEFSPDCHVTNWAYSEFQMIVDGYFMSQKV